MEANKMMQLQGNQIGESSNNVSGGLNQDESRINIGDKESGDYNERELTCRSVQMKHSKYTPTSIGDGKISRILAEMEENTWRIKKALEKIVGSREEISLKLKAAEDVFRLKEENRRLMEAYNKVMWTSSPIGQLISSSSPFPLRIPASNVEEHGVDTTVHLQYEMQQFGPAMMIGKIKGGFRKKFEDKIGMVQGLCEKNYEIILALFGGTLEFIHEIGTRPMSETEGSKVRKYLLLAANGVGFLLLLCGMLRRPRAPRLAHLLILLGIIIGAAAILFSMSSLYLNAAGVLGDAIAAASWLLAAAALLW